MKGKDLIGRVNRIKQSRYVRSLRFAGYCMTHPLDGFWDLTHEKRGTLAAAHTILILTLVTKLLKLQYTSFLFNKVQWEEVNIFFEIATILFPLALWCVGNWGLTTLFDGKGRLDQVYMGTCYALAPYPMMQLPLILLSRMVTLGEGEFYTVLSGISLFWAAALILAAMTQIHEYTVKKMLLFTVASLFAMLVIVFILLLFVSMISQGVAYFISLWKEIMFRL